MARRDDDFSEKTRRILAERAGQRCSNPDCRRGTTGPSLINQDKPFSLGVAGHITAAAEGGPRYDGNLTPEQRKSPDNGIWLCSICAKSVDHPEAANNYTPALLRQWKLQAEDKAAITRSFTPMRLQYPIRELQLFNFGGFRGQATVQLGELTLFHGTHKLSQPITRLLRAFCDRGFFEQLKQIPDDDIRTSIPLSEQPLLVAQFTQINPKGATENGRISLRLSDDRLISIVATGSGAELFINGTSQPVFYPAVSVVSLPEDLRLSIVPHDPDEIQESMLERIARRYSISPAELAKCLTGGTPSVISPFSQEFRITEEGEVEVRWVGRKWFSSLSRVSGGEFDRFTLDLSTRIAHFVSQTNPSVLAIDQNHVPAIDCHNWSEYFSWISNEPQHFQAIFDFHCPPPIPSSGRELCYLATGGYLDVDSFQSIDSRRFFGLSKRNS